MRIEQIEGKIAEQQEIIIEADAKLRAWLEVREAFSETRTPRKAREKARARPSLQPTPVTTDLIYEVIAGLPANAKFTSADLKDRILARMGEDADPRYVSTAVCGFLHTAVRSGKRHRCPVKICGVKNRLKLYKRQ